MGPLKLIGFILLSVTIGYSLGAGIDCSHSGNCVTNTYLTKITCTRDFDATQNDCQCEDGGANNECSLVTDLDSISFVEVDDEKCRSWCENINTDPQICKFWKFMHSGFDTTCYLMDKEGCQGTATEKCEDTTGNDPKPACKSGHMVRAPDCDPANLPPTNTCPGPIETLGDGTGPDKFYQKWLCYHLPNPDPIDMYTETTMPEGGFCELILGGDDHHGSCLKLQPKYKFICQDDGNGKGVWTKSDDTMVEEGIKNGKLTDIQCAAPSLVSAPVLPEPFLRTTR